MPLPVIYVCVCTSLIITVLPYYRIPYSVFRLIPYRKSRENVSEFAVGKNFARLAVALQWLASVELFEALTGTLPVAVLA